MISNFHARVRTYKKRKMEIDRPKLIITKVDELNVQLSLDCNTTASFNYLILRNVQN